MSDLHISVTVLSAKEGGCSVVRLAGEADVTTTVLRDALAAEVCVRSPGSDSRPRLAAGALHAKIAGHRRAGSRGRLRRAGR